jgi:hypothetical protein
MLKPCRDRDPAPGGRPESRSSARRLSDRETAREIPLRPIAERLMTEIAARRSSGRLLRHRDSEHNRRRMGKQRSLPTLAPMSQQHGSSRRSSPVEPDSSRAAAGTPLCLPTCCATPAPPWPSTRGWGERECRTRSGTQAPRQPATTTPSAIVIPIPLNRLGEVPAFVRSGYPARGATRGPNRNRPRSRRLGRPRR